MQIKDRHYETVKRMIFNYIYGQDLNSNHLSIDDNELCNFEDCFDRWWINYLKEVV